MPRRLTSLVIGRWALRGASLFAFALILMPIFFVSWLSFFQNELLTFPPTGYTLRWFAAIWQQNQFVDGFIASLEVALIATAGGLVLGVPASLALSRATFPGREAVATLLTGPLIVPGIVIGTALFVSFVEVEIATELPLTGSVIGLALGHVLITIPWTVRLITAGLAGFDRAIEEAAMNLGADRWTTLVKVTLPIIRPAMVAAGLFSFVVSFENLEISLFLVAPGATTLPIAILQYVEWKLDPSIAAVSLVQIVIIAGALIATNRFVKLSQVI